MWESGEVKEGGRGWKGRWKDSFGERKDDDVCQKNKKQISEFLSKLTNTNNLTNANTHSHTHADTHAHIITHRPKKGKNNYNVYCFMKSLHTDSHRLVGKLLNNTIIDQG